ncbi:MAG: hypothetical protein INH41_02320 [Myxococcaceae bacterium]|nr:hypothetical protein [Myxococcaceae bacterium]MCA3011215.1 hypothetical protein [Myxococcaceae bacterium]
MRVVGLVLLLVAHGASAAVRFALVIGHDVGLPDERALHWAESDAAKVFRLLTELGGVDEARGALLQGQPVRAVELAMARLAGQVAEARRRGEWTEVIVFFSGHGDLATLHLGDDRLPRATLEAWVKAVPADATLVFIDACRTGPVRSGASKGLRRAPAFDVRFSRQAGMSGRVTIESVGADESAQESDDLQSGFFTHHLLAGLRGAADVDRDKRVSLAEAYRYAYHRTVTTSFGAAEAAQHPSMSAELEGEGEFIVTSLDRASALLQVEADVSGELLVLDDAAGTVVSEVRLSGAGPLVLALPVGDYRLVRRAGSRVWAGRARLVWGRSATVTAEQLVEQPRVAAMQRGASLEVAPWRLWAGGSAAAPRALGAGISLGVRAGVERRLTGLWGVGLRLGGGSARALTPRWALQQVEVAGGPVVTVERAVGLVRLGLALGVEGVGIVSAGVHLEAERLASADAGPVQTDGWTLGAGFQADAWVGLALPASLELRLSAGMAVSWVVVSGQPRTTWAPALVVALAVAR